MPRVWLYLNWRGLDTLGKGNRTPFNPAKAKQSWLERRRAQGLPDQLTDDEWAAIHAETDAKLAELKVERARRANAERERKAEERRFRERMM